MHHPAAESVIEFYRRHAIEWDRIRQRQFPERGWLERFSGALSPGGELLDLGCGSGSPLGGYFIKRGYRITGIDTSEPLLRLCRAHYRDHNWQLADMRELALDRRFHGIIAWDSFFHLTPREQREMFPRFKAHALPGAMLIFNSGPEEGEVVGDFLGDPLYHASLSAYEYQTLLSQNGFTLVDFVISDVDCGGRTVWLARYGD